MSTQERTATLVNLPEKLCDQLGFDHWHLPPQDVKAGAIKASAVMTENGLWLRHDTSRQGADPSLRVYRTREEADRARNTALLTLIVRVEQLEEDCSDHSFGLRLHRLLAVYREVVFESNLLSTLAGYLRVVSDIEAAKREELVRLVGAADEGFKKVPSLPFCALGDHFLPA